MPEQARALSIAWYLVHGYCSGEGYPTNVGLCRINASKMCSAPAVSHQSMYRTGHEEVHSGMLESSSQAAPCAPSAKAPSTSQSNAFAHKWLRSVRPRLQQLITLLARHEVVKNIALAQVWWLFVYPRLIGCLVERLGPLSITWHLPYLTLPCLPTVVQVFTYLPVLMEGTQLLKAEPLCVLGSPALEEYHHLCCNQGVPLSVLGPMSKVWQHGAVQIIQAANSLPTNIHPLNRMSPQAASSLVAEIIYLPVYDAIVGESATQGVVAAIEIMISPQNVDVMIVANVISTVSQVMEGLNLALNSNTPAALAQQPTAVNISRQGPMTRTTSVRMLSPLQ